MFDGVADQLHQFIASSNTNTTTTTSISTSTTTTRRTSNSATTTTCSNSSSLLPALSSFPLHHPNSFEAVAAVNYNSHHHHQFLPFQPHFLQPLLHQVHIKPTDHELPKPTAAVGPGCPNNLVSVDLEIETAQRSMAPPQLLPSATAAVVDPTWTNDEVLALLRIRSTMENWFPDFTWEHVSRKLAELGFKRSAEKCKEKFEEESRYFTNNNINNNSNSNNFSSKNYMMRFQLSELEDLFHGEINPPDQNNSTNNIINTAIGAAQKNLQRVLENPSDDDDDHDLHQQLPAVVAGDQQDHKRGSSTTHHDQSLEDLEILEQNNKDDLPDNNNNIDDDIHHDKELMEEEQMVKGVVEKSSSKSMISKKRKRHNHHHEKVKFDMLKGFCEDIVNKMMAQQEEIHNKLLEDMMKRDEEKVAKEEAWKKQEMDRMNKELEIMAHEQALAGDRQATIIEFLKKFTYSSNCSSNCTTTIITSPDQQNQICRSAKNGKDSSHHLKVLKNISPTNPVSLITSSSPSSSLIVNPITSTTTSHHLENQSDNNIERHQELSSSSAMMVRHQDNNKNDNSTINPVVVVTPPAPAPDHQNPSSSSSPPPPPKNPSTTSLTTNNASNDNKAADDVGKRWPRDEVLALINLRCSLYSTSTGDHQGAVPDGNKEIGANNNKAAPLWERISQAMWDLGYKRSAKRCKEKWENINKYFRKTKDVNKKRSLDSRTCPYFHHLSTLYNKGALQVVSSSNSSLNSQALLESSSTTCLASAALPPSDNNNNNNNNNNNSSHHDHQIYHDSSQVHVAHEGDERADNDTTTARQEVPAAFDFEF